MEGICKFIDRINEWVGKVIMWFFLPLMLLIVTDVFTRYVLNKPWYYLDFNVQITGCIAIMGAGYGLLHNAHIGVDILVLGWSPRKRALLSLFLSPIFFTGVGALLWKVIEAGLYAISVSEVSALSGLGTPLYPYKSMMGVGVFLLMLQGISKFLRDLVIVTSHGAQP